MPRYVAFLRGVMPTNARMPALRAAFEAAGFAHVRTVLGTGNVVFDAQSAPEAQLERRAEAAMQATLGRVFYPVVRSTVDLADLMARAPYDRLGIPPEAKRVVSFAREPLVARVPLPLAEEGASVFLADGREGYTAYLPGPRPVFMALIARAFGDALTTRTLSTVARCAQA